jgi:hypothetical protein
MRSKENGYILFSIFRNGAVEVTYAERLDDRLGSRPLTVLSQVVPIVCFLYNETVMTFHFISSFDSCGSQDWKMMLMVGMKRVIGENNGCWSP